MSRFDQPAAEVFTAVPTKERHVGGKYQWGFITIKEMSHFSGNCFEVVSQIRFDLLLTFAMAMVVSLAGITAKTSVTATASRWLAAMMLQSHFWLADADRLRCRQRKATRCPLSMTAGLASFAAPSTNSTRHPFICGDLRELLAVDQEVVFHHIFCIATDVPATPPGRSQWSPTAGSSMAGRAVHVGHVHRQAQRPSDSDHPGDNR